jgi:sugar/nucleoside kinase (ribokinase family)
MTAPLPEDLPGPQTAIVTGSDSGIGRSVAVALAGGGLDVGITWHKDAEGAERTADEVRAAGGKAAIRHLDLDDLPTSTGAIDALADELGGVDVLVNNAGTNDGGKALELDFETWRHVLSVDLVYRRLAADLCAVGCRVVADLAGERLDAALAGGIHFLKVSDEELVDDERASGTDPVELVKAMHRLRDNGAHAVLVSRADEPALALLDEKSDDVLEVHMPPLHAQDSSGAGDSMTAAVAAALNLGAELTDAVRLGAAAGALNVTRAGLGTGDGGAARELAGLVELRPHD